MAVIYGPDGHMRAFGALHKQYRADLLDGTLPSWLTLPTTGDFTGASVAASTADGGGVAVTTSAAANRMAGVQMPSVDLTEVAAVRLQATITDDATDRNLYIGFGGSGIGGLAIQFDRSSLTRLIGRGSGGETTLDVAYGMDGVSKRYTVSLLLVTSDKTLAIGDGGEAWIQHTFGAAMDLGAVTPEIAWRTGDGTAVTGHIHQVMLDLWWR